MKNHLSMLGSMGAGARFWPWGMLNLLGSARSGEWGTVTLALHPLALDNGLRVIGADLQRNVTLGGLAGNEPLPRLGAFADDIRGVPIWPLALLLLLVK
jgi:hypothetical protein